MLRKRRSSTHSGVCASSTSGREFYPWFYVLLRHRCFKQRTRAGTRPESGPLPEREAPQGPPAEQAIDLHAALARLERADRELIVLKHLDGWTYDELAVQARDPARHGDEPALQRPAQAAHALGRRTTVTTGRDQKCDSVQLAAMARLDGEADTGRK